MCSLVFYYQLILCQVYSKNGNSNFKTFVSYLFVNVLPMLEVFDNFLRFFELFERHGGYKKGHLKLKKPKQLQEVLDIARDLLNESGHDPNPEVLEKKAKLQQLKLVLEM